MENLLIVLFCLPVIFLIGSLVRNRWVYKSRVGLLYNDREAYLRLESYDVMIWKFWIWDVNKFVKPVEV